MRALLCIPARLLAVSLALTTGLSEAGEAGKVERKGPLASLPSEPKGEHLAKIKALDDNQWVNLGSPAPDPKWGTARGRAWGGKAFALAPDIRGAYFTGEGSHAFVKPDGYGMDDYWVYDINAHRWICTYPGTNTKAFTELVRSGALRADDRGLVVDKEGRLVPGHLLIHAWGLLTYDTDRKKLAFLASSGYGEYYFPGCSSGSRLKEGILEGLRLLNGQMKTKAVENLSPWFYSTATGEFERYPTTTPQPISQMRLPQFFYVTSKRQYLLIDYRVMALFDPDRKLWTMVKSTGTGPSQSDIAACHDSKRDRIYMGAHYKGEKNSILAYDIGTETWTDPAAKGECPLVWSTNRCSVHYDSVNDAVLILHYGDKKLYVYDPKAGNWEKPIPMPDGMMRRNDCGHAFYDPELNVHFVFFAGDSADNGVMWAYRYKKAAK